MIKIVGYQSPAVREDEPSSEEARGRTFERHFATPLELQSWLVALASQGRAIVVESAVEIG